ncbi:MAG: hypothetical protein LBL33_08250 [Tannerella sp.]|nr:hypothetical protein [Tannerella sp.]
MYWLDFGNIRNAGQVILGTFGEIRQPQSKKYIPAGKQPALRNASTWQKSMKESGPPAPLAEAAA